MKVKYGKGRTFHGPGVLVELTADEVTVAIDAYLVAHRVYASGPCTIRIGKRPCQSAQVYIDPCGEVVFKGKRFSGRGK